MNRFAAMAAVLTISALLSACGEAPGKSRRAPSPAASVQNGAVVLGPPVQAQNGIRTARLRSIVTAEQIKASAIVLSAQGLIDVSRNCVTATERLSQARAALNVSQQEYERLKSLLADQNVSVKQVQAAEGTFLSDTAAFRAAQNALSLTEAAAVQSWGPTVADWVIRQSPAFTRLAHQQEFLVQMTPPAGSKPVRPREASFVLPDGSVASAAYVSPYPQVDPRIQSPTYLYLTRSRTDLAPGMTLAALLPQRSVRGVEIPESAAVWRDGEAWAYVQLGPDRFVRRPVPTQIPIRGGWLVTKNFSPGEAVVISGAQQLLSEEFRSQTQAGGEEGEEGDED